MPDSVLPRGFVLSFDFGLRRIGAAVGQSTTCTANSLETIANGKTPDWKAIDRLVREWKPQAFVVGLPLNNEGEETEMSGRARKFGEQLIKRFEHHVYYVDERLTSHAAQDAFIDMRTQGTMRRKHAKGLDAMAARIILENWLQSLASDRDTAA